MRKVVPLCLVIFALLACVVPALSAASTPAAAWRARVQRPRSKKGTVCGDPTLTCRTGAHFEPYSLPFRISERDVIWESEPFYAVILKSVRDEAQDGTVFVAEAERVEAQRLFLHNKVYTSRAGEPGDVYYSNVGLDQQFMAVYAGRTRAEAAAVLAKVKATGKYPGANLRRMHVGFNGT
ncbi:MAG: hypothetical protein QOH49_3126 [Acidobacteriota bacterium]|jgi:hypothetical protein|nr:hypothetical protein [Acidobacteriota bacterium]